jgi:hypothetical protein
MAVETSVLWLLGFLTTRMPPRFPFTIITHLTALQSLPPGQMHSVRAISSHLLVVVPVYWSKLPGVSAFTY